MNSRDKSILISYYWSKIIENVLIVIDAWVTVQSGLRWNYKLLCYSASSSVCIAIFMIHFLMQSSHKRSQFHFRLFQVNRIAKIDFFVVMLSGVMMIGYPTYICRNFYGIRQSHEGHEMLCRIVGMIAFGMSIQSFCCPSFMYEKDKKAFFQARLCVWFLELLTAFYGYVCLKGLSESGFYKNVAGNLVWGSILFYGYYLVQQQLGEYQNQVEISILESEASFNQSKMSSPSGVEEMSDSSSIEAKKNE